MNKYKMRFFEEPDDNKGGHGAAVFDEPAKSTVAEPDLGGGEPDDKPVVETLPAAPTIDAKAFAKEFGAVIGEQFKKDKETPALTAEEAKKLLKVWDPGDDWYAKFDNLETRKAAVAEMRDALVIQNDTLSQHRIQELRQGLEEKFGPILERIQQMDTEQREARFDSTFPQLAKPTLKPLLHAVAQDLLNKGKTFEDESSMFTALANGVEAVIKETNPDFKLTAGSNPAPTKGRAANTIPVTSPGSGGGTAATKPTQSNKPRGLAIFEK